MLARIHKAMADKDNDKGFTLIELLVVMIIIGILAAIAIPVFLSQRKKGYDTSAKADVSTIGKEIATYYVDGIGTLTATYVGTTTPATVQIKDGGSYDSGLIKLSDGTAGLKATPTVITISSLANGVGSCVATTPASARWFVGVSNSKGTGVDYYYSAGQGLTIGAPTSC